MEDLPALATWLTSVNDSMYEEYSTEKNLEYYSNFYIQRGPMLSETNRARIVAMFNL